MLQFPSPCGDYGSYREVDFLTDKLIKERFRPLAGIMVLIAALLEDDGFPGQLSFRPLAGIMVLI